MHKRLCRAAAILVVVLSAASVYAQTDPGNLWFVRGGLTPSFILPTNPFSLSNPQNVSPNAWAPGFTVEVGRRTDGSKDWHQNYNLPSYGFGISTATFKNHDEIVRPLEAYTFFSWPFARMSSRLSMTSDFGMGLSWNWTAVNAQQNARTVLGSNLNARIDWGLYLRYVSTPRTTIFAGFDVTHRSNGGLVQPNQGINVIGPKITVQYNLGRDAAYLSELRPAPPFHSDWDVIVGGFGGLKNVMQSSSPLIRQDFHEFEATAAVRRRFYNFGRVESGIDLMYDGSTGTALDKDGYVWRAASSQPLSIGAYGGYEHLIGRFSAFADAGILLARTSDGADRSPFYQRYGWRYQFSDRMFTTLAIRAVGGKKADAFELGVGYRIHRVTSR